MLQGKQLDDVRKIIHEEFTWEASDGKFLFAQKWDAGVDARGAIMLVHGFAEHSTRYYQWATSFAENGFSVLAFDLRGHGKTAKKFGEYSHYQKYISDIELLIEQGRKHFKNIPVFLYGHSMGGNLVINYSITHSPDIDGIIVTSPWFELAVQLPHHLLLLVNIVGRFYPRLIVSTPIRPEDISRELREVHKYKTDPFVHNKISFGFLSQIIQHGLTGKRSIYRINVPLLVMHGTGDNITSCQASKEFVMNAGPKTSFITWPDAFHELHNDLDRDEVQASILNWLNKQIIK